MPTRTVQAPSRVALRLEPSNDTSLLRMFSICSIDRPGVNRGRESLEWLVPTRTIHSQDGQTLLANSGRAVRDEQPALLFHNFDPRSAVFNAHRLVEGDVFVCRDPLAVLKAYEGGVENCVSIPGAHHAPEPGDPSGAYGP